MRIKKSTSLYLFIIFLICSQSVFGQKKKKRKKTKTKISAQDKVKAERMFFDAHKEKGKENYFEALKLFELAAKTNPSIDAAWFEIAQINVMQKDYKSSLSNIEKALKISPKNKWYREFYGQMLSATAQFGKAAEVFKALRTDHPNKPGYYFDEVFFLLKQNKDKEALNVYGELERKLGVQEKTSFGKYKIFLKESNVAGAEKELVKLCDAYPNNLNYLNKLAKFQLLNNEQDKAEKTLKTILEKDGENTSALLSLADLYKKQGKEDEYKKYSKKAFSNPSVSLDTKIAVLYNYINQYQKKEVDNLDDAFEYTELLSQTHPEDAKTWAIYGDLYNLAEKPEKAIVKYKKSLSLQQDIFSVWQQLFFLQSDQKKYKDLIIETDKAKEFFPNQSLVYFFNGLANQQEKNLEKATKSYERGVKMAANQPALQAQFYGNLGESYNQLKNYEKSDKNFDKALLLEPKNQYTLNNYAYYLSLRSENLEKAKQMSKQSLELSPDNPTYLDTYAWILYKNKEYKKALEIQQKAVQLSEKPSAEMYEHLGDILYMQKMKDAAKLNWEKAKELGGDSPALNKKIETGVLEN